MDLITFSRASRRRWLLTLLPLLLPPSVWGQYNEPTTSQLEWLRSHLIALDTVDPAKDLGDLRRLRDAVDDARIVALGEGTHGTREFSQMKHRIFEYLVTQCGFGLFGLETTQRRADSINEYVLHGAGDPRQIVGRLNAVWNTEEMLTLVEWIRDFNESGGPTVRVVGFDIDLPDGVTNGQKVARDRKMAAQIRALLEQYAQTKIVLWAHNVHVSRAEDRMGQYLAHDFGNRYVPVAFATAQGVYRARDAHGASATYPLGAPPKGSIEAVLAAAHAPLALLDLRQPGSGDSAWMDDPRPFRTIGAVATHPKFQFRETELARDFDLLVYIEHTSPSVPLPDYQ